MHEIEKIMFKYHEVLKKEKTDADSKRKAQLQQHAKNQILRLHKELLEKDPKLSKAEALKKAIKMTTETAKKSVEIKTQKNSQMGESNEDVAKITPPSRGLDPLERFKTMKPFLVVDTVSPDSPAERAGLRKFDEIIKLGSINRENQTPEALRNTVAHSEGKPMELIVKRGNNGRGKLEKLILVPKRWRGQGLLGYTINIQATNSVELVHYYHKIILS